MNPIGVIKEETAKAPPLCNYLIFESGHVLIAGTTGSGKSVLMNSLIYSIVRCNRGHFIALDLKRVELSDWAGVRPCLKICTEPSDVLKTLDGVIAIMEDRYKTMEKAHEKLYSGERLWVIVDELADLTNIKGALDRLVRIGRLGRAAKIKLICATQDPSRKTLSGALMQNLTMRMALRCNDAIESRMIIHARGAELLPLYGKGLLHDTFGIHQFNIPMISDGDLERIQTAYRKRSIISRIYWAIRARFKSYSILNDVFWVDKTYYRRIKEGLATWGPSEEDTNAVIALSELP